MRRVFGTRVWNSDMGQLALILAYRFHDVPDKISKFTKMKPLVLKNSREVEKMWILK